MTPTPPWNFSENAFVFGLQGFPVECRTQNRIWHCPAFFLAGSGGEFAVGGGCLGNEYNVVFGSRINAFRWLMGVNGGVNSSSMSRTSSSGARSIRCKTALPTLAAIQQNPPIALPPKSTLIRWHSYFSSDLVQILGIWGFGPTRVGVFDKPNPYRYSISQNSLYQYRYFQQSSYLYWYFHECR